jgi:Rrf2 family protein
MSKAHIVQNTAEYALRSMAYLAIVLQKNGNRKVSSEEIADATEIPRTYLSKVLRMLVTKGLLQADRGHGGGFCLAKAPSDITFQLILEATGSSFSSEHCAFGWERCDAHAPCPLHNSYKNLESKFYSWASTTTLAEISSDTLSLHKS